MSKKFLPFLFIFVAGCGDPTSPQPQQENPLRRSWKLNSANNMGFGVDEIEIDGQKYLILHDGGRAHQIIPKLPTKAEKDR